MRMIDADEVMRDAEHISAFRNNLAGLSDLAIALSGGHTIEAEPVKHGRWEEVEYWKARRGRCTHYTAKRCSVCKRDVKKRSRHRFCPNCGAKMSEDD